MTSAVLSLAEAAAENVRVTGPKAATLARLRRAGLPIPDGFCLLMNAYRAQLGSAGLERVARRVGRVSEREAPRLALEVRLGLLRAPLQTMVAQGLGAAYGQLALEPSTLVAVRSSASSEDTPVASFAGQLETMLGVASQRDLLTAVRACWASLWTTRAVRYMRAHGLDPARTAVAVMVQRLLPARAAGGALSRTPDGRLVLTAAWGLGPAVAQGEVIPDRYVLRREGPVLEAVEPGHKTRALTCSAGGELRWQAIAADRVAAPCLVEAEAVALARLVLGAEAMLGSPAEVEWALDQDGIQILQARPLVSAPGRAANRPELGGRELTGQPASGGWAAGRACVIRSETELARPGPGDVLVTRVPGPALAAVLPGVAGVVAELGGSTSHLAALARERGIPAVLGVRGATRCIPEGSLVVVDGNEGVVRWRVEGVG